MYDKELTLAVLNPHEQLLGFIHPKYVDVSENNDMTGLRSLQITHPIFDDNQKNLNYYNNLLTHGNKIWYDLSPDGNGCLYVLLDNKVVDPSKNSVTITGEEAATELSAMPPVQLASASRTIDEAFIDDKFGSLFRPGTIETVTLNYTGVIGLMALLRLITTNTGKEIQFRYQYDPENNTISRYIDIVTTMGTLHKTPIEIGYNTDNILIEDTEATTAIAAAPTGTPQKQAAADITVFNQIQTDFKNLIVDPAVQIPSVVTKDGTNEVNGPLVYPPYAKSAGTNYVVCPGDSSDAVYKEIQEMENGAGKYPRTVLFSSTETNKYNLYWACVDQINKVKQPTIVLTAAVIDIPKMKGADPEYYNAGDTVYVQLPGRTMRVKARVTKTTKNPRQPDKDKITIGNYSLDFFRDYSNIYMNAISPFE